MEAARHSRIPEIKVKESRLVFSNKSSKGGSGAENREIGKTRRTPKDRARDGAALRVADRGLGRAAVEGPQEREDHLYDDNTISVFRNDREVFLGTIPQIMKRHSDANWLRIQIDFAQDNWTRPSGCRGKQAGHPSQGLRP